jgi:hypothetical protein
VTRRRTSPARPAPPVPVPAAPPPPPPAPPPDPAELLAAEKAEQARRDREAALALVHFDAQALDGATAPFCGTKTWGYATANPEAVDCKPCLALLDRVHAVEPRYPYHFCGAPLLVLEHALALARMRRAHNVLSKVNAGAEAPPWLFCLRCHQPVPVPHRFALLQAHRAGLAEGLA